MRVAFLGVGEAFGANANVALLVNRELLIECGPHALIQLRRLGVSPAEIKLVFISHLHGDHFLGLPALLLAAREEGRQEPLTLLGPPELRELAEELLHLSYRRSLEDLPYRVEFVEAKCKAELHSYRMGFAPTRHSLPAMAISIERRKKLTYACDGAPTGEVVKLARDSDLLVAEAYGEGFSEHSSPLLAAQLASRAGVKLLALVHLWRGQGEGELKRAREIFEKILLPADLETVEI